MFQIHATANWKKKVDKILRDLGVSRPPKTSRAQQGGSALKPEEKQAILHFG